MKILPANIYQNPINSTQQYRNNLADTKCVRINNKPTFKSAELYKKIFEKPDLSEKFMKLVGQGVAAAAAALFGVAVFNDKDSEKFLDQFIKSNNDTAKRLEETENELKKYKAKSEALEKEIEDLKSQKEKAQSFPAQKAKTEEFYAAFPKRAGRLSKPYEQLKKTVAAIPLSQEYADKVTKICANLMEKGTKLINGNEINNSDIALNFANELEKAENKKEIVDKFYQICGFGETKETTKSSDTKIFSTEIPQIASPNIVGKINLDSLNDKRKRFIRQKEQTSEIISQDNSGETFTFKLPRAADNDLSENINILFKHFEKQIFGKYLEAVKINPEKAKANKPFWKYNKPVPVRIRPEDIQKEIYRHNGNGSDENGFTSRYKRIQKQPPQRIVDIINSDPRYHQLFTIHSAMRFIDRFIVFNSDIDEETQSKIVLDKLTEIIQNALKDGAKIETYHADRNFTAPRLVISAESFDKKAQDIFGTIDIKITFCEKQTGYRHVANFENPEALICTIFSDGV